MNKSQGLGEWLKLEMQGINFFSELRREQSPLTISFGDLCSPELWEINPVVVIYYDRKIIQ